MISLETWTVNAYSESWDGVNALAGESPRNARVGFKGESLRLGRGTRENRAGLILEGCTHDLEVPSYNVTSRQYFAVETEHSRGGSSNGRFDAT